MACRATDYPRHISSWFEAVNYSASACNVELFIHPLKDQSFTWTVQSDGPVLQNSYPSPPMWKNWSVTNIPGWICQYLHQRTDWSLSLQVHFSSDIFLYFSIKICSICCRDLIWEFCDLFLLTWRLWVNEDKNIIGWTVTHASD